MEAFWGTLSGLILALVVYVFTEMALEWNNKRKYKGYLKDELTFNSRLLDNVINRIRTDRTTIANREANIFATYFQYIFQMGILQHTFNKGYFFDFIRNTNDRGHILEFTYSIVNKLNDIDFRIREYQRDIGTREIALQQLSFQEHELNRIKVNINNIIVKL